MQPNLAKGKTWSAERLLIDPDDLAAIADAALAEEDETLSLLVAPGLVLELAYDRCGPFAATWRTGSWWRAAEIGEA
ncbi:hypothetical protein WMF31_08900 [Sorangium sp. So ce1036]|uniref:hypothetical protein n=1 Tax=Sorangium sp. So ce1036 TaxID=3133328 RepID=UPI003F12984A